MKHLFVCLFLETRSIRLTLVNQFVYCVNLKVFITFLFVLLFRFEASIKVKL